MPGDGPAMTPSERQEVENLKAHVDLVELNLNP